MGLSFYMISKNKFQFRSLINRSSKEVFDWHLRNRMLERSIPPYEKITIISSNARPNQIGSKIILRTKFLGLILTTTSLEYTDFISNESFTKIAKEGLLKKLQHKTLITPQNNHTCEVIDCFVFSHDWCFFNLLINYSLQKRIARILRYKHNLINHDIGIIKKYPFEKPLKVLISGSHGLIGKNLAYFLEFLGHDVWYLTRLKSKEKKTIFWNDKTGESNLRSFEGFDIIVHLAGENIGKGRWTKKKKNRILKSRCEGTKNLVEIVKKLEKPPKVFISASAIGYYGNCGNDIVNENSPPGKNLFISKVCQEWEESSKGLEEKGIRVVWARFGVVLSSAGGALRKMLIPFRWGLGGKLGNGHQYVSWIAINDAIGSIYHIMMTPSLEGAVNIVAPHPVPNDILTKKLSKRLNRWRGIPTPEFILRLLFGQKGEELLLTSIRAEPYRLIESGYHFCYPELSQALKHVV